MAIERNGLPVVGYGEGVGLNQSAVQGGTGPLVVKPDAYYDMMLLKMLRQMEFHYAKYAIQKSLPKNFGDTINWRRFKKLEVADNLGLLVEGETPTGKEGVKGESIQAVIQQYGEVMYFTDLVDLQQLDDVRREYTIELGYIAQETLDTIVRNVLVAEGSVYFGGTKGNPAVANATVADVSTSTKADARPSIDVFRRIILGFKKDYVTGVRGAAGRYIALVSPEVMFALFDDQRMIQYMNFGQTNAPLMDGMVIDLFGIRFEEVLNAPVIGNAHDSIILADEAYAITKLQGEGNVRVITKGLGSAGVADPLDQRQSIGYKITGFSAKVLRSESVVNYWSNPTISVDDVNVSVYDVPAASKLLGAGEAGQTGEAFTFTIKNAASEVTHTLVGVNSISYAQALEFLGLAKDLTLYPAVTAGTTAIADNTKEFITANVEVFSALASE